MADLREIREVLDRRDLDQARALLAPIIRSAPSGASIEDLETMAALAEELGEAPWAEKAYNLILRSSPDHSGALSSLAALAEEKGDLEKACALREKFAEAMPDDSRNLLVLRGMYHALRWERQVQRVEKLLESSGVRLEGGEPFSFVEEEGDSESEPLLDASVVVDPSDADVARFLALFSGREDLHARQWYSPRKGISGYSPVNEPMTARHVRQHFFGDITLGVYPIRLDGTCRFFALDLDLSKSAIEWAHRGREEAEKIRRQLQESLEKTTHGLQQLGLKPLIEDSGYKGFHLWVFLDRPERSEVLYGLGRILRPRLEEELPPGINLEFFPKQARRKGKGLGNLIKLPLGIHRRTGRRAWLLDRDGQPVPKPFHALLGVSRLSHSSLMALVDSLGVVHQFPASVADSGKGSSAPPWENGSSSSAAVSPVAPPEAPRWTEADFGRHPVISHVLERCPVLEELLRRALENRHLEHDEIIILQQSLGHLPGGVAAFNYILDRCPGVGPSLRLKSPLRGNSISCPKIRKRIPGVSSRLDCACDFPGIDDHYPTPVLHIRTAPNGRALPPEEKPDTEELVRKYLALAARIEDLKNEQAALQKAVVTAVSAIGGGLDIDGGRIEIRRDGSLAELHWIPGGDAEEEKTGA